MNKFDRPVVLIGGGGHASVLADLLLRQGETIAAVIAPDELSQRIVFNGITHYRRDDDIDRFSCDSVYLVNALGMMPKTTLRKRINHAFMAKGYTFISVISDCSIISPFAVLGTAVQVLDGAIIQAGARIGAHSIVNTGALIEHDCLIGEYNHIAPRATLCGQVETGDEVFVGAGAIIIQNITLAQKAIVGAGSIMKKNLASEDVCYPAIGEILSKSKIQR